MPIRVLTVCLGNICRSPVAEEAIRVAARMAGVEIEVDSAGTGGWHVGERAHAGSRRAASAAGLELTGRARMIEPSDFEEFDLILAMDQANRDDLLALAPSAANKIRLLLDFDPAAPTTEVPDPYYGTSADFDRMVDLILPAADGVVAAIARGEI